MLFSAYFLPENTKWPVLVVALPAWLFGIATWTDVLALGQRSTWDSGHRTL
ncbi:hypothetical protein ACFOWZ_22470 [Lentzea rhizosphaerae]|uniref:Uncharacterized protein n=1 Tax=Lentzea rhizosphaerae TaxID=2041025 RepID=A0ABV8BVB7_9PSEU